MSNFKITLITPTFNSSKTIEKTINSVIEQNYSNLEYIIIDGGSTDGTLNIIKKYSDKITTFISEKDKGISDAFNKGIKLATGDFIGIINSDDELLIDALNRFSYSYDGQSDIYCGSIIAKGKRGYILQKPDTDLDHLRYKMTIPHPGTLIRKSCYEKNGGYSLEYKAAMDRELLLRMYLRGAIFQFSDEPIALFNCGSGISTKNPALYNIPEDKRISIKYGVDADVANKIERKNKLYACFRSTFSKAADYIHLWNCINKINPVGIRANELSRYIFNYKEERR